MLKGLTLSMSTVGKDNFSPGAFRALKDCSRNAVVDNNLSCIDSAKFLCKVVRLLVRCCHEIVNLFIVEFIFIIKFDLNLQTLLNGNLQLRLNDCPAYFLLARCLLNMFSFSILPQDKPCIVEGWLLGILILAIVVAVVVIGDASHVRLDDDGCCTHFLLLFLNSFLFAEIALRPDCNVVLMHDWKLNIAVIIIESISIKIDINIRSAVRIRPRQAVDVAWLNLLLLSQVGKRLLLVALRA